MPATISVCNAKTVDDCSAILRDLYRRNCRNLGSRQMQPSSRQQTNMDWNVRRSRGKEAVNRRLEHELQSFQEAPRRGLHALSALVAHVLLICLEQEAKSDLKKIMTAGAVNEDEKPRSKTKKADPGAASLADTDTRAPASSKASSLERCGGGKLPIQC